MSILSHESPYRTLTVTFLAWKVLLLAIAVGSQVGPLYDTSSSLLTLSADHDETPIRKLVTRLCSWDAIYFIKAAQRGYLFEQEWAFGSALPACISLVIRALTALGLVDALTNEGGAGAHLAALVGAIITHGCHFLSSLVLYELGLHIWADSTWALVSALLHVLSPAGIFLSAPYQESPCSLLSFVGWLLLVKSCVGSRRATPASRDVLTLLAGVSFGLGTVFRTNGLLNGAPFAFEFLATLYHLVEDLEPGSSAAHIRRLAVLGLSGLFVAAGSVVPQFIAYRIYCAGGDGAGLEVRPWCLSLVPSIYGFVQREYWNTGFLRYWTIPNAPLFLLAAPMLFIMAKSGKDIFFQAGKISQPQASGSKHVVDGDGARLRLVVRSMAFAQVALAGLAFTSYHVQIITRLSSGYPAWYWWVAACLRSSKTRKMGTGFVVFMVMYALIQAVLFASFLPPA